MATLAHPHPTHNRPLPTAEIQVGPQHSQNLCMGPPEQINPTQTSTPTIMLPPTLHSVPTLMAPTTHHSAPTYTAPTTLHSDPTTIAPTTHYSAPIIMPPTALHSDPTLMAPTTHHSVPPPVALVATTAQGQFFSTTPVTPVVQPNPSQGTLLAPTGQNNQGPNVPMTTLPPPTQNAIPSARPEGFPLELITTMMEQLLAKRDPPPKESPPASTVSSARFRPPPAPTMGHGWGGHPHAAAPGAAGFPHPMATMMYSPQAAQMVAEITKPAIFEDRPEDWDRFDREWRKYEQLITATGLIMPDAMRLEALRSRVGPASKLTLQELEDKNPRTEFSQYYQALVRQYSRDATGQARLAWQKVRLQTGSDGLLNLNIFKKFQGEFKVYRNRVGDWTATEEYDLLLRNLPAFWIQQLKIEENKRQRSRFWVKLTNAPDMSAGELREALEEAGRRVK